MSDVHAVILAGGSGSRLWPLSRQHLPKQFLSLDGDASLLQTTINRLSPVIDASNVLIVTQESHAKGEAYHALLPYQALFEPIGRNTAPAIALAAAYLTAHGADPVMVVLPADHIIKDEARFRAHLELAIKAAESGKLITFGIQPTRPDTGFGYIKTRGLRTEGQEQGLRTEGRGLSEKTTRGSTQSSVLKPQSCLSESSVLKPQSCLHQSCIYDVERFTEKPDHAIRELRNAVNHEYEEDADRLTQFFTEIVEATPELFGCHQRLLDFCANAYAIKPE